MGEHSPITMTGVSVPAPIVPRRDISLYSQFVWKLPGVGWKKAPGTIAGSESAWGSLTGVCPRILVWFASWLLRGAPPVTS